MAAREQINCECGGRLSRPIPKKCPHCGCEIAGVNVRQPSRLIPLLLVGLMFGILIGFVWWMARGS